MYEFLCQLDVMLQSLTNWLSYAAIIVAVTLALCQLIYFIIEKRRTAMSIFEKRMSSFVDRGNKLIAEGKTKEAMKLITQGLQHYSDLILRALTPYSESDAGLLVFALRHIADEIEKNNPAAKPLYEGMKKVVIAPPLTEIQKVKKANRL